MINPIIIKGMEKLKNCPKKALKVENILLIDSGKYNPKTIPRTIAIKTLKSKFENKCFIIYTN